MRTPDSQPEEVADSLEVQEGTTEQYAALREEALHSVTTALPLEERRYLVHTLMSKIDQSLQAQERKVEEMRTKLDIGHLSSADKSRLEQQLKQGEDELSNLRRRYEKIEKGAQALTAKNEGLMNAATTALKNRQEFLIQNPKLAQELREQLISIHNQLEALSVLLLEKEFGFKQRLSLPGRTFSGLLGLQEKALLTGLDPLAGEDRIEKAYARLETESTSGDIQAKIKGLEENPDWRLQVATSNLAHPQARHHQWYHQGGGRKNDDQIYGDIHQELVDQVPDVMGVIPEIVEDSHN